MSHTQDKPLMQDIPEGPWMRRLRESNWIWLVKEEEYATIAFPWHPPEPGFMSGRLVLNRFRQEHDGFYRGETQVWFVGSRGEGFDGKQLVVPCDGVLAETFAEFVDENVEQLLAALKHLNQKFNDLNGKYHQLEFRMKKLEKEEGFPKFDYPDVHWGPFQKPGAN